jgi:L-lactate dehydrogenase complex protein LldF
MYQRTEDFRDLSVGALQDAQLCAAVKRASNHFRDARERCFSAFPEHDAFRLRARQARLRTLRELPQLLEQLETTLEANGIVVHWARDGAEATSTVAALARHYGCKSVVKGKSMISEEIGLNDVLQAEGLDVCETDLGEYIIQLAGEPPSHIIAPAIHKSREQVSELFRKHLGKTSEVITELTAIARETLRERFFGADMGITGVNMAVAATGSIVLVENEGNIRMCTTCPRVHVAVMSIEKVVAGLEEMAAVLQMLPRSATGQKLSSYVSVISGPRREDEDDGPDHVHVVILDNGRSAMYADEELRETLLCVRCGACLGACPVYRGIGGHSYGWSYSGPIGALLAPQLLPRDKAADLPKACTSCGACADVCPVGIQHHKLLLALRRRYAEDPAWGGEPLGRRLLLDAYTFAATHPLTYRAVAAMVRAYARLDPEYAVLKRLPLGGALRRYAVERKPPTLKTPFSRLWEQRHKDKEDGK